MRVFALFVLAPLLAACMLRPASPEQPTAPPPLSASEQRYAETVKEEITNLKTAVGHLAELYSDRKSTGAWATEVQVTIAGVVAIANEAGQLDAPARYAQAHRSYLAALREYRDMAAAFLRGDPGAANVSRDRGDRALSLAELQQQQAGWP